jgi:hypothetical protein
LPSHSKPPAAAADGADRGKRATFDRKTGAVSGSGSGAGDSSVGNEDYDRNLGTGSGSDRQGGEPGNGA